MDAILAARERHHFLSVHKNGQVAVVATRGNDECHLILRGGKSPNYDADSVTSAAAALAAAGLPERVMIDMSHMNSGKNFRRQIDVATDVAGQIVRGDRRIIGVMVESHLVEGRQDLAPGQPLTYGQSITDACLGWKETVPLLESLAEAVRRRRL